MIDAQSEDSWDERKLCPDEACIGVIGDDGRCKVCGSLSPDGPPVASAPRIEAVVELTPIAAPEPAGAEAGFDEDRRLCPDGACIGVIGDDGRCKVCGTAAA